MNAVHSSPVSVVRGCTECSASSEQILEKELQHRFWNEFFMEKEALILPKTAAGEPSFAEHSISLNQELIENIDLVAGQQAVSRQILLLANFGLLVLVPSTVIL